MNSKTMRLTSAVAPTESDVPEEKIAAILLEAEAGTPVREICRRHGISELTFYRWRGRGVRVGEGKHEKRIKALEEELRVLRRLLAFQALDLQQLKERIDGGRGASPGISPLAHS